MIAVGNSVTVVGSARSVLKSFCGIDVHAVLTTRAPRTPRLLAGRSVRAGASAGCRRDVLPISYHSHTTHPTRVARGPLSPHAVVALEYLYMEAASCTGDTTDADILLRGDNCDASKFAIRRCCTRGPLLRAARLFYAVQPSY